MHNQKDQTEIATFASGCFWCAEAIFRRLKGVTKVTPGYTGGALTNPSYDQVCSGKTGHAETVQILFDPTVISYSQLLEVFWHLHDPTTLNRQGNDIGTQYRSAVFYHSDSQRQYAIEMKNRLDASGTFSNRIVTEIVPFEEFYPSEDYHHEYYEKNREYSYCQIIIDPKIRKLYKDYKDLTVDNSAVVSDTSLENKLRVN